jgi:hypothetical protein
LGEVTRRAEGVLGRRIVPRVFRRRRTRVVNLLEHADEFYGLERLWADSEKVDGVEPVIADG